jgi:hypothetical protein
LERFQHWLKKRCFTIKLWIKYLNVENEINVSTKTPTKYLA